MTEENEEKKNLDLNNNSKNSFSKPETIFDEEEKEKIHQKKNKKTEKLKLKLTSLVKKINAKITENAEILYRKDPSPTEIQWLTEQYDSKKRALQIEQKINHSYKVQYNILENKLKNRKNLKESKSDSNNMENEITVNKTQSLKSLRLPNKNKNININISSNLYMSLEDQINKVRNENNDILNKIRNIKNKKVLQIKEVDNIINGEYENEYKQKNDELNKLQSLKVDAIEKYKTTLKSLEQIKKKIEYFEEKIQKNKNQTQEENDNITKNNK